jgi:hypothetical protein
MTGHRRMISGEANQTKRDEQLLQHKTSPI